MPLARGAEEVQELSPIDGLEWLSGCWVMGEGGAEGEYLEETWSPAREDALVGCFRWSRGGEVWLYEIMVIEVEGDSLVFRLRHFDRGLKPWASEADGPLTYPLAELASGRVVFENPERDSPRRFVYEREGDRLSVSIEGANGEATPLLFRRVD